MGMLYLVRHGQASAGTHDYDRLSPLGQRQSQLLGQWWTSQKFAPDLVYHGSLRRQRDTARLALEHLGSALQPDVHEGLNEYTHRIIEKHFGAAPEVGTESESGTESGTEADNHESLTFEDYISVMQRWRDHSAHPDLPEIEPWADFANRGWETMRSLHQQQGDKQHHVFVTSGGVIATVLAAVLGLDFSHTVDAIWRIRNSSVTTLNFDGKTARLVDFNTVPHLQLQNDPSLITLI
ncbi:histidine phosphatase family protein [Granulosicoccus antarcticus]|uniref:Histidine phosphatase family protein n=1 Tax=Granulosicoccus antarcticus IMCC3135 TaxID=1192854 RepID=A0A2Z2NWA0_9GAMM|nr:histidine phosphatase family protein [Granulosicoccus antarcticus]ASJ75609.1 hypothetical protein IMCC3135_27780 [Granulosicoccus antarcticus IMCC3135]